MIAGYHLTVSNSFDYPKTADMIKDIIRSARDNGMVVKATVMDQGSSNKGV